MMEEIPFDERRAAIKKHSVSLLGADEDASTASTTASIATILSSDIQLGLGTSIEVGNGSEDELLSLYNDENYNISLVDSMCQPADSICQNESDIDIRSVARTIDTDNNESYTYFPKKQYRHHCHVDYVGCASEQPSPSSVLDVVDACRGWLSIATTNGERALQSFLDGPAPSKRHSGHRSTTSGSIVERSR